MPIKIFSCRLRPQQLLGLFGKLGTSQFSKEAKLFSVSTVKFLTTPFQNNISSNYFQCKTFKRILLTHPFYFLTKWVIDGAPILHFSMQLLVYDRIPNIRPNIRPVVAEIIRPNIRPTRPKRRICIKRRFLPISRNFSKKSDIFSNLQLRHLIFCKNFFL